MAPKTAPDQNKVDKKPNSLTGQKDVPAAVVVPKGNT